MYAISFSIESTCRINVIMYNSFGNYEPDKQTSLGKPHMFPLLVLPCDTRPLVDNMCS